MNFLWHWQFQIAATLPAEMVSIVQKLARDLSVLQAADCGASFLLALVSQLTLSYYLPNVLESSVELRFSLLLG